MSTDKAEPLLRATSGPPPPQRGVSDASALISHFDDWARVLDNEAESSLSRRGSGKLEGLEPDALRSTVDGLLKRQPGPSKLQPHAAPHPMVCDVQSLLLHLECSLQCHAAPQCSKSCHKTQVVFRLCLPGKALQSQAPLALVSKHGFMRLCSCFVLIQRACWTTCLA